MINDSIKVNRSTGHKSRLNSVKLFNRTFSIIENKKTKLFDFTPISPIQHEKPFGFSKKKLLKKQRKINFNLYNCPQQHNYTTKMNKVNVNPKLITPKNTKCINKSVNTTTITIKKINYAQFINKKPKRTVSKDIKKTEKNIKKEKRRKSITFTNNNINSINTINTNHNSSINQLSNDFMNIINNINSISNKSTSTTTSSYSCNFLPKNKNFNKHQISENNDSSYIKYFNISNNYNELTLNYNFCNRNLDNFLGKGLISKYAEAQNKFFKDYFATYIQKIFRGFYFRLYELPFINNCKDFSAMSNKNSNVYLKKKLSNNSFNAHQNFKQKLKYNNFTSSKNVNNRNRIPKIREIEIKGIGLKKNNTAEIGIFKRQNKEINKNIEKRKFVNLVNNMLSLKNCIDFWRNIVWMEKIRRNIIYLKKNKEIKLRNTIKNIVINFDNKKKNLNNCNNNFLFNTNNDFSFKK